MMNAHMLKLNSAAVLCAGALAFGPASTWAADASDDWRYSGSIYLWGAGIKGETAGGANVDVSFDTLIRNLNMAFMGAFEARKSAWSWGVDVVYLNVGADDGGTVPVSLEPGSTVDVQADASVKTKGWVLNLFGAYNVARTEQASLDVLLGARYLNLELDFDLGLAAAQYRVAREISASNDSWDGVIGVKGRVNLNERWYLPYYVDMGTGQSDFTWQALGGVAYSFDWGDVSLAYRHIDWEFGSSSKVDNINFSGPVLAATWHF
jgi:hypothetical protein